MTLEELEKERKRRIIPGLRRVSRWWTAKVEAMKKQKVSPGKYKCEMCNEVYPQKEIKMDHKEPVVDPKTSFVDWNTYIERMFCNEEGFQALCESCHFLKTTLEHEVRKVYRKKIKKTLK